MNIIEAMKVRKSTRTFQDRPLESRSKELISSVLGDSGSTAPWGSDIKLGFIELDKGAVTGSGDKIGTYGVIKNQQGYVYGICPASYDGIVDFSYLFQKMIISLTKEKIDTVWLGGTFSRKGLFREVDVPQGYTVPAITPVGYAAEKRRLGERIARKITKTTQRKDGALLFFENSFEKSLDTTELGPLAEAFEMVRIGPSAMNGQTWRLVKEGNSIHFYNELSARNYKNEKMRRYQMLDMGIAMYHFEAAAVENGYSGRFIKENPHINRPTEFFSYIGTFRLNDGGL